MRKCIIVFIFIMLLARPAQAMEFTAPEVPDSGRELMPEEPQTFGEGLWYIICRGIEITRPELAAAVRLCLLLVAIVLLMRFLTSLSEGVANAAKLAGAVAIGTVLLQSANTMIQLAADTVISLSEYGKLLLPVMSAAMAAQGSFSTSAALYTGTTLFSTVLSTLISRWLIPLIYIFLVLSIAGCAVEQNILCKFRDLIKWLITWSLKILLYIFTGYISITGVVSGSADASLLKATKLAISGSVPVVGSILSDASESVLVSVGIMKGAAGIYGVLAILATWVGPFMQIGLQYILLKTTAAVCGVFGEKKLVGLTQDFSAAMGLMLAMVSSICLMLTIATACFMKGVST